MSWMLNRNRYKNKKKHHYFFIKQLYSKARQQKRHRWCRIFNRCINAVAQFRPHATIPAFAFHSNGTRSLSFRSSEGQRQTLDVVRLREKSREQSVLAFNSDDLKCGRSKMIEENHKGVKPVMGDFHCKKPIWKPYDESRSCLLRTVTISINKPECHCLRPQEKIPEAETDHWVKPGTGYSAATCAKSSEMGSYCMPEIWAPMSLQKTYV